MKKFICVLLAVFILLPAVQLAAAQDVIILAVNDKMLPITEPLPFKQGRYTYVPYTVFTNYLGMLASHNTEQKTLAVYNQDTTIFFHLNLGIATDFYMNSYAVSAIEKNGTIYLPSEFICLKLKYTFANYEGPTFRLKSNAKIPDIAFEAIVAAEYPRILEAYNGSNSQQSGPSSTSPGISPEIPSVPTAKTARLIFDSALNDHTVRILDLLDRNGVKATFFLEPGQIAASPELVRRIYATGHAVGILCAGEQTLEDVNAANDALFRTIYTKTRLVCARESLGASLTQAGYRVWSENVNSNTADAVINTLKGLNTSAVIRFDDSVVTTASLTRIFSFMKTNGYSISVINEYDNPR